jgi:hypothetical protein
VAVQEVPPLAYAIVLVDAMSPFEFLLEIVPANGVKLLDEVA